MNANFPINDGNGSRHSGHATCSQPESLKFN